jgi:hypothetical protein
MPVNPSTWEAKGRNLAIRGWPQAKNVRPNLKNNQAQRTRALAQVVKLLPSKLEVLSSNTRTESWGQRRQGVWRPHLNQQLLSMVVQTNKQKNEGRKNEVRKIWSLYTRRGLDLALGLSLSLSCAPAGMWDIGPSRPKAEP